MPPSRLSVITVVRNAAGTIGRCLESVASQQQRVEHIVIDGGSTDGTADIVRAFSPNLAWWCSEPDRGISDAFNKGLRRATGDIIGILNADDWYEPESLAVIRAAFEQNPETEIIHGRVRYWNGDVPVRVADGNHRALRKSGSVNHPSVFVRHSVYRQLGLFDCSYRYAMDYELMLRWLVRGKRFRHIPLVLANMRLGGISDARRIMALREVRRAQRTYLDKTQADVQHLWLVGRYRIRQVVETFGLDSVIAWQRSANRGMRSVDLT